MNLKLFDKPTTFEGNYSGRMLEVNMMLEKSSKRVHPKKYLFKLTKSFLL